MARPTDIAAKILRALPFVVLTALFLGAVWYLQGCATRDIGVVTPVEPAPGGTVAPFERLNKKAP